MPCAQKRPADFEPEAAPRQAPGVVAQRLSSGQQLAAQPQQQPSKPSAPPRRDPNSAGMQPPKTGVPQRDKMRDLLRDALALALDDVPDGRPGVPCALGLLPSRLSPSLPPTRFVHILVEHKCWPLFARRQCSIYAP